MRFPVNGRAALVGLVVAGAAAAAAALGPATTAVGQSSAPIQLQIQMNSPGTLAAKGAGVNVSVTASCSGPVNSASAFVSLTEVVGKDLASGSGAAAVNCTGTTQTVTMTVVAGSGKAFRRGSAIATASIQACTTDFSSCNNQQVQTTIKIS